VAVLCLAVPRCASGGDEVETVAAGELERERAGGLRVLERKVGGGIRRWQGRTRRLIVTTTGITIDMSTRAGEIEGQVATGFGEFGERPCRAGKQEGPMEWE
jgi:hypothetical protein